MATIKSFTSVEQSRKLAEILPLESADNIIVSFGSSIGAKTVIMPKETLDIIRTPFSDIRKTTMCWSLAALLFVLDYPSLTQNKEDEWEVCVPNCESDGYIKVSADNPVDACVAMIGTLHGLNLL